MLEMILIRPEASAGALASSPKEAFLVPKALDGQAQAE